MKKLHRGYLSAACPNHVAQGHTRVIIKRVTRPLLNTTHGKTANLRMTCNDGWARTYLAKNTQNGADIVRKFWEKPTLFHGVKVMCCNDKECDTFKACTEMKSDHCVGL